MSSPGTASERDGGRRMGPLNGWHHVVETGDLESLHDLLADEVVFHSPVVHTPVTGKTMVSAYLAGAYHVLAPGGFRYVREIVGPSDAVLEFTTEVDGIQVNGVDLIAWDSAGRITDFKVMIRPKKAFDLVHRKMGELLAAASDAGPRGADEAGIA